MRRLLRKKARANMEKAGFTNINRRLPVYGNNGAVVRTESKFQKHWKEYC